MEMRWSNDGVSMEEEQKKSRLFRKENSREKKKICARKNSDVLLVVKHQLATKILEF